jgi:acyl-CoA thioester hydrolase
VSTPEATTATGRAVTLLCHRVAFYQTDAMGIMHHANYLHLLENSRVAWLAEHDRPYREYVAANMHFAVTRVDVQYRSAARFDDELVVEVDLEWVRGASLGMRYTIHRGEVLVATARTAHALLDGDGRPQRIPDDARERLLVLAAPVADPASS